MRQHFDMTIAVDSDVLITYCHILILSVAVVLGGIAGLLVTRVMLTGVFGLVALKPNSMKVDHRLVYI